ncbi:lytic murein transglycosylase [Jannaschia sp. W003]|uniref:lytic murein transglycosylase n=1 Tax=Jannaschia sp. W003 TaxID=2867012 RepID=UPI0021A54B6F|nr:lytic murein transglycosylase [Jannaschia sp. W003]UWQ22821.1 lytic murein transglycosylase [Jannaschia sp. W003]
MFTRRAFVLSTLALAACTAEAQVRPVPRGADPGLVPQRTANWLAWVEGYKPRARSAGIDAGVIDRAFARAGYLAGVVERDRNQTEFKRSFEDYLQLVASEERVRLGREAFARQRSKLEAIEARHGVPAEVVAAIWGVESRYGERRGDIGVVSATSTLAYDGRRGSFFEKQLTAALRILQRGDTTPDRLVGSWAGAMGHTQFIPTSYQAYAVDFDGDGRRDIWSDDPSDALASTAAYLERSGWRRGERWGGETGSGGLQPDPGGPRFATGRNFGVIKRYNNSDSYALAVGYLSDRIAGAGPLEASFGPDRYGLTLAERQELQRRLGAAGFDAGKPDGVIGTGTREAIEAAQRSLGVAVTGDPSPALLRALGG